MGMLAFTESFCMCRRKVMSTMTPFQHSGQGRRQSCVQSSVMSVDGTLQPGALVDQGPGRICKAGWAQRDGGHLQTRKCNTNCWVRMGVPASYVFARGPRGNDRNVQNFKHR